MRYEQDNSEGDAILLSHSMLVQNFRLCAALWAYAASQPAGNADVWSGQLSSAQESLVIFGPLDLRNRKQARGGRAGGPSIIARTE